MNKIPTLFVRDPDDRRHLLPIVTPGCEWVMAGEGVATRKYDGTCVSFDGDDWWARREVKPGKPEPDGWHQIGEADPATGKRVGWEPIESSGFYRWWKKAVGPFPGDPRYWPTGTYELCGPKINGNPEGFPHHFLLRHALAERYYELDRPASFDEIRQLLLHDVRLVMWEGIVWHHPDGRMAKIKRRDFA